MDYQYVGLPLTSAVAAELIVELFSGKTERRQTIIDAVSTAHKSRGGADATAVDLPRVIKKGLEVLQKKGLCSNPSTGHWRINSDVHDLGEPEVKLNLPLESSSNLPVASRVVGNGDGSVYVYFFPAYRRVAETEGRNTWPCKIGRSDRDPILRILSQSSTALPEKPEIALLIKTQQAATLETALHSILKMRGLWRRDSPGSEWFETSPDQILALLSLLEISQ